MLLSVDRATIAAVDGATAALIGAGTASVVSLGGQFLAHTLSLARDRRNQRRQRLASIADAGALLYSRGERMTQEELEAREPDRESFAARHPEVVLDVGRYAERIADGIVVLQVEFGNRHWLVSDYVETANSCLQAEQAQGAHLRKATSERIVSIDKLLEELAAAQRARDEWMKKARAEVERI